MLTDLGRRMEELRENFSGDLENIRKNQSELNNTIIEIKNTRGNQQRLDDTEEQKSDWVISTTLSSQ